LAYQGIFSKEKFSCLGIDEEYFSPSYLEFYGKINLLKGGIIFADMVNTVSPTYSRQIQTKEFGCGLESVLRQRKDRLWGVLNGIDVEIWNPCQDSFIYQRYSSSSIEEKYINKVKLREELGLRKDENIFLLGMVTRLAEQKGIDILIKALDKILEKYQLVVLGTGDEVYHQQLEKKAKNRGEVFSLNLKFDETLAHKIYAASDVFLLPSRFEPCGLSQMISYRYGTIPIVHHTGGLADTVKDYSRGGGGFVFKRYHPKALLEAIMRAEALFKSDRKEWISLMKKVMEYDFSWQKTAKDYIKMYEKCLSLD
ncbi:MAG: glycogen synthase, partial [Caldiserica bacterium]